MRLPPMPHSASANDTPQTPPTQSVRLSFSPESPMDQRRAPPPESFDVAKQGRKRHSGTPPDESTRKAPPLVQRTNMQASIPSTHQPLPSSMPFEQQGALTASVATATSSSANLPPLMAAPAVVTTAASASLQTYTNVTGYTRQMNTNYNNADANQEHGGTQIQDIITSMRESLKQGTTFTLLVPPHRFTDKSKFKHCLDLIELVATEDQRQKLKTNLDNMELQEIADCIKKKCLLQLNKLGKLVGIKATKSKAGYSGVGLRVCSLKSKLKTKYGNAVSLRSAQFYVEKAEAAAVTAAVTRVAPATAQEEPATAQEEPAPAQEAPAPARKAPAPARKVRDKGQTTIQFGTKKPSKEIV